MRLALLFRTGLCVAGTGSHCYANLYSMYKLVGLHPEIVPIVGVIIAFYWLSALVEFEKVELVGNARYVFATVHIVFAALILAVFFINASGELVSWDQSDLRFKINFFLVFMGLVGVPVILYLVKNAKFK